MNIIEIQPISNGAHRNQSGGNVCPDGWAVIPDSMAIPDTFPFVSIEVDGHTVTNMTAGIMPTPDVEAIKIEKIKTSKEMLALYLGSHPLTWTDGKQYSATEDKQALLTGNIAAYQLAVTLGQSAELTWNATGEECVVWTFENLAALAVAIKAYVKPLVAYQQVYEVSVNACTTEDAINAIPLDYSSVVTNV